MSEADSITPPSPEDLFRSAGHDLSRLADCAFTPWPIGAAGELCLGMRSMALSWLRRAEAERKRAEKAEERLAAAIAAVERWRPNALTIWAEQFLNAVLGALEDKMP